MYTEICNQFRRYLGHVINNIGGKFKNYKTVDEPGAIYADVPKEQQVRALDFLAENVFEEPAWLIAEPYIDRLYSDKKSVTSRIGTYMVILMLNRAADELNDAYPYNEFIGDMVDRLFRKAFSGSRLTAYDQQLETSFVSGLCHMFSQANPFGSYRKYMLSTLRSLRTRLARTTSADADTKAHLASLVDYIDRTLVIK